MIEAVWLTSCFPSTCCHLLCNDGGCRSQNAAISPRTFMLILLSISLSLCCEDTSSISGRERVFIKDFKKRKKLCKGGVNKQRCYYRCLSQPELADINLKQAGRENNPSQGCTNNDMQTLQGRSDLWELKFFFSFVDICMSCKNFTFATFKHPEGLGTAASWWCFQEAPFCKKN